MGAVDTTYTFTATDTITSTKMNNIIDQTTMTSDAIIGTTLEVASGKLKVRAQGITSNEMATGSVTSNAILDGTIVNDDINASAAIAGTKISPNFGSQNISNTGGNLLISNTGSCVAQTTSGTVTGQFYASSTSPSVAVGSISNNPLVVFTNSTERMRITAAGNVGINTTAPISKLGVTANTSNQSPETGVHGISIYAGDAGKEMFMGYDSAVDIGYINAAKSGSARPVVLQSRGGNVGIGKTNPSTVLDVNGAVTAAAFVTASDYRLKEECVILSDGLVKVNALKPTNFKWIGGGTSVNGFIAHEVQAIVPDAIIGEKDAIDLDGNPIYQKIDQLQLIPILVAAIQELSQKVAELEAK